ncbi:uncharacterized protein LOC133807089 [Humulus lupulus]|uniref:uncharacterized protein LOC133807089 n=1 Tax=Humulus lupulus TaxID=3486 RepID=UPI002B413D5F|nr:uncharacterized protein LOC133807089 [Humulus lupulus]
MHSDRASRETYSLEQSKSMGKKLKDEEEKKKKTIKETTKVPNKTNEVIITVHVEQPWPWPRKEAGDIPFKKSAKSKLIFPPNQQKTKTRGYDRRAQLLAYAQQLRKSDSKQLQWPKNGSKPKHKVNVQVGFQRIRNRKRYKRLVPEVDISCNPKSIIGRKKKANKHTDSPFVGKVRGILRGLCKD